MGQRDGHFVLSSPRRVMFWRRLWRAYDACWRAWYVMHVEHKGAYSPERLQVLHHFLECQKSNAASVILDVLVAVGTPLPCLAIALVSDAMPLAPPEDGPRANGMFWARSWLIMASFTLAVLLPIHHPCIAPIRERRVLLIVLSAGISAVYTGFYFAVALAVGFPVPFSYLTLNMVWISLIVAGLWAYMDPESRASAFVRQRLKLHAIFIYAASSLAVVYPLFYYAFLCAREYASAQFLLTFALPFIKMMEKLLLYHTTHHASDIQPVLIAFNVEVFNALFVSSCMRNATSISVTIALMVADFMGACAALYGLRNVLLHIDALNVKMGAGFTRAGMVAVAAAIASRHHPDALVIHQSDEDMERSGRTGAATVTPWEATGSTGVVDNMHSNRNGNDRVVNDAATIDPPTSPSKIAWGKKIMSSKLNAVVPAESSPISALHRGPSVDQMANDAVLVQMIEELTLKERQQFVHEACRVLRRVEFLLLVEYTEVMVPFIYGECRISFGLLM